MKAGKRVRCLFMVWGIAFMSLLAASGEPAWIPIETENAHWKTEADSGRVPLETRIFHTVAGGTEAVDSRVKTCDISEWMFLNTEKFYGFFLILK